MTCIGGSAARTRGQAGSYRNAKPLPQQPSRVFFAAFCPRSFPIPHNPASSSHGNTDHDGDCVGRDWRLRWAASVADHPGRFCPKVFPGGTRTPACRTEAHRPRPDRGEAVAADRGGKATGKAGSSETGGIRNRRTGGREVAHNCLDERAFGRPSSRPSNPRAAGPRRDRGVGDKTLTFQLLE
jgi:hypothetical protein